MAAHVLGVPAAAYAIGLVLSSTVWCIRRPSATTAGWLSAPRQRPRVYVTLGTVSFGAVEVLRRALIDLSSLDVDVLVTVGPDGDPAALGELADLGERVHVERFVAQSAVLDLVDLVVHHGGTGTVLGAQPRSLRCGRRPRWSPTWSDLPAPESGSGAAGSTVPVRGANRAGG